MEMALQLHLESPDKLISNLLAIIGFRVILLGESNLAPTHFARIPRIISDRYSS